MVRVIFDDLRSLIHFVAGIATKILSRLFTAGAVALFLAFVAYQLLEKEQGVKKLGDFIEYILGYIMADIVMG